MTMSSVALNKLELNNKITALKAEALQARTQVIQKLIKRIAAFKKNDNDKSKKKLEMVSEEIKILKKLSFRELIRSALLLEKDPQIIITCGTSSATDRCLARICSTKFGTKLRGLKELFHLDADENRKSFHEMGNRNKKKETSAVKTKQGKQKVTNADTTMEWEVESEGEKEETLDKETFDSDKELKVEKKPKPLKKVAKNLDTEAETKPKKKKLPKIAAPKVEFSSESENEEEEENAADSFFITTSGQNYLTSASKPAKNTFFNDDVPEFADSRRYRSREDKWARNESDTSWRQPQHDFPRKQENSYRKTDRRAEVPAWTKAKKDENLHPSWQAKQRMRDIKPFEGRKIKFDSDDKPQVIVANKVEREKPEEGLHPSWAAKKNKPAIAAFQGTKIKFDE